MPCQPIKLSALALPAEMIGVLRMVPTFQVVLLAKRIRSMYWWLLENQSFTERWSLALT